MSRRYQIGRTPLRHGRRYMAAALTVLALSCGTAGLAIKDLRASHGHVSGVSRTIAEAEAPAERTVDEPYYTLQLPGNWTEKSRIANPDEQSITWHVSHDGQTIRSITLYTDRIQPNVAINRLLPVDVTDAKLSPRELSEPCTSFQHVATDSKTPTATTYQTIEFICDVPHPTGTVAGTGSSGTINSTAITGPTKGKHQYFWVYTDTTAQPDYQIFTTAIKSFQAK